LDFSADEGAIITVTRTASPNAFTVNGDLGKGAVLYYGDVL
jgi:hypothetical protein